jgi:serine/threonine protein kinase
MTVPLRAKGPDSAPVAVKLLKHGYSPTVLERFEAERQALALMDHPSIAHVYDAGSTEKGQPYFVMEHVPGTPITEFCDSHLLNCKERLQLFQQVCQAVHHAHQKGVIHRDLKPSNILIGEQDGRPVPKVIDFGIAKAVNQRLTENTIFTEFGVMMGTPELKRWSVTAGCDTRRPPNWPRRRRPAQRSGL